MVTAIPEKLRSNAALRDFFDKLNAGPVEAVHICPQLQELPRILKKRADYLRKLEKTCTVVDVIEHYHKLIQSYDHLVSKARSLSYPPTTVGFVTFADQKSASVIAQTLTHTQAYTCVTQIAPDPRDILWDNLYRTRREVLVRKAATELVIFILLCFWTYPVATLASWLGVDGLQKVFPYIQEWIDRNAITRGMIFKLLPSLFVLVFMAIVPIILEPLIRFQRKPSRSLVELAVLKKYFLFQLINVLLIFTVASTFFSSFYAIVEKPTDITTILGRQLPLFAPFFINYVTILGLGYLPLKLVQLGPMILLSIRRLYCSSPRDYAELLTPVNIDYGWAYPIPMLVFVIVLTYSVMAPLILVFGAAYFSIAYLFQKYNFLYVYFRRFETGGIFWPVVARRLVFGVFIFQLTMLGVLILNNAYVSGLLIAPLFVITVVAYRRIFRALEERSRFLPLELSELIVPKSPDECTNPEPIPTTDLDLLDDQYEAAPTSKTDYRESPMSRCPGILDASERTYSHPAMVGVLPKLWLPRTIVGVKNDSSIYATTDEKHEVQL
ncbi:DUF221-domain-containing protein [Basidiobolus meristosporus CBS 931.73]|uniref:DUF221-domain-containing protein n=1 Tax=Basidiobolus meristosporus CBS 931.73 TaxID=1314790 RepID=A0A1Y1VR48_9FUNG|nr:DUF221-domain-containing protein [Basidiobolus meristosporus CBS 931.73]|eukprot:ORX63747.1 DUF221-domain-containing protein [Basidiobolus meristosporus CBS 931.73]